MYLADPQAGAAVTSASPSLTAFCWTTCSRARCRGGIHPASRWPPPARLTGVPEQY